MGSIANEGYLVYKTINGVSYTQINMNFNHENDNKNTLDTIENIEEEIYNYIRINKIKILSLDVFDTYLLRNSKPEAARYLELSEKIIKRLKEDYLDREGKLAFNSLDVCLARIAGMQATYRTRPRVEGCGEGDIREVLSMQCHLLGLPKEVKDILLEEEVEYESKNLTENTLLARLARRFRKEGGKVVLISDMYLGADIIEDIIQRVVKHRIHQHLFSSADIILSKRSGKIFPVVEKALNCPPDRFLHIGDSWVGDVEKPRKAGWHAMHLPVSRTELNRRKAALAEFIHEMDKKGINTRAWAKL